jgi:uncharacterized protein (DUF1810 family)
MSDKASPDSDPFNLQRFVRAQASEIDQVREELRSGRKRGHWMWFVFPQLSGLGQSWTSREYAIKSLDEARAYLADPLLGPRIIECTQLVNSVNGRSVHQIFGHPDDLKFHSSMTLFSHVTLDTPVFREALNKYFDGALDPLTMRRL